MNTRVSALVFLLTLTLSSLAVEVSAKPSFEKANPLTLSTFSEISPIWSDGSVTLSTLVAGSGFAATPTLASSAKTVVIQTTWVTTFSSSTTYTVIPDPSPSRVTSAMVTVSLVTFTTLRSTVTQLGSSTSTVTDIASGVSTAMATSTITDNASGTTSGAVSSSSSTSKAAAPTLIACLGSLLGVAVGAVVLL